MGIARLEIVLSQKEVKLAEVLLFEIIVYKIQIQPLNKCLMV